MSRVVTNEEKTYVNLHRTVPLNLKGSQPLWDYCIFFATFVNIREVAELCELLQSKYLTTYIYSYIFLFLRDYTR